MSDLTRYRIVTEYEWDASIVRAVDDAITRGTLIPDTTLQDIAAAWKVFRQATYPDSTGEWNQFCLEMDALTQEDTP